MQKQLLSASALLLATGMAVPTFAQFTLSLGAQSNQLEISSHNQLFFSNFQPHNEQNIAQNNLNLNNSNNSQETNVGGELAAGYQFNYDATYNVAIEIFGQLSNTRVETPVAPNGIDVLTTLYSVPLADATASFEWLAGIRMRPGYYVTPAVRLFIDGGIVWGDFELEQSDALHHFVNATLATNFDQSQTETLVGWRYGAGVEYQFNEMMALGLDYIITEFDEFSSDFVEDAAAAGAIIYGSPINAHADYTPTMHTLGLNFKLLFGGTQKQTSSPDVMMDK